MYWVVDSETTGVRNEDKTVEVAGILCDGDRIIKTYSSLVNPGIPIPPAASAVHHITDRHVADAPGLEEAMLPFFDEDFDFVVAHNAAFDKRFMDFGNAPWVCTWKLSSRIYPDAPSHSNQVLRYWLGLPDPQLADVSMAHRALYDAEVTTHLFHSLLSKATSDDPIPKMIDISNKPVLLVTCKFGKHAGSICSCGPFHFINVS